MREAGRTPLWAYTLWPLGACFLGVSKVRAACYGAGVFRRVTLRRPAISVGNLTFGGTGKTPVTIALAKVLLSMGEKPAVLLRGYGRKTRGALRVGPESGPSEVGEEALVIAHNLPDVEVAVGERREQAAAITSEGTTIFLLDDAFQHLRVRRDLDILLVDASKPRDLRIPPVGRLREPLSSTNRADLIVVTRGRAEDLSSKLGGRLEGRPVISVRFRWEERLHPEGAGTLASWKGRKVFLFAGVGNSAAFLRMAQQAGFYPEGALLFPDHAEPDRARVQSVLDNVRAGAFEAVLTTEKDAVKWLPVWDGPVPLLYCRLETELEDPNGHLERALSVLHMGAP